MPSATSSLRERASFFAVPRSLLDTAGLGFLGNGKTLPGPETYVAQVRKRLHIFATGWLARSLKSLIFIRLHFYSDRGIQNAR